MMNSATMRIATAIGTVGAVLIALSGAAHADAVTDAFTAIGTSATTTIGLGIALLITVMTLGFGVAILRKFVKKAPSAV